MPLAMRLTVENSPSTTIGVVPIEVVFAVAEFELGPQPGGQDSAAGGEDAEAVLHRDVQGPAATPTIPSPAGARTIR